MTTGLPTDPLASAGTFSRAGTDLFRRASERVVADLGRRTTGITTGMTWSVSRVESGHQVHLHVNGDLITAGETLPWGDSLCRRMVEGGRAIVADTLTDPSYADHPAAGRFRGFAGMPIRGDDGSTFGMLCGVTSEPFSGDLGIDEAELELLTGLLADVLDGARLSDSAHAAERSALVLAQTDHLTGLVNRRGWDLAVEQARESLESYGDHMSVVIVDLDDFKAVNDREGHQAGDEQLRLAGRILTGLVRRDDVVARIGGDEFGVLLVSCSETEADHREADIFDGLNVQSVAASTGHATATTAAEFETLVARADQAMYRAKTASRGAVAR